MTYFLSVIQQTHYGRGYLGHSSSWSFSHWVFKTVNDHLGQSNSPELLISFDANAYELEWGPSQIALSSPASNVPAVDHALYLMHTVKFHICQLFPLFDEAEFMIELHEFYGEPSEKMKSSKMWYINFLLILAFGKAFHGQSANTTSPPGSSYFVQAMNLLPNTEAMYREPIVAIEILCMVSLYLQSVDMRRSAYSYVRPRFLLRPLCLTPLIENTTTDRTGFTNRLDPGPA